MNHILNYFCKLSQAQLKNKIETINKERKLLREKPLYSHLKKRITCTDLYKNKPKIIKNILNEDYTQLKNLLTYTIAESIKENMKLKPELITDDDDEKLSMQLKRGNREFLSVLEIFWGDTEEILNFESEIYYNLILNFCLDFLADKRTQYLMNKNLINYIPYARYFSYEDAIKESVDSELMSFLIMENYENANIDILGEAIYNFSKSNKAREVANLFVKCVNSKVSYDSKDSYGKFEKKVENVYFKNFHIAFEQNLDKFLEIISLNENNLGERAYNIIKEDCKLIYEITHVEMSGVMEDRYLTVTEKPLYDVYRKLSASNSNYINELIVFQKDLEGDIEKEYFNKKLFDEYKSQYYCEERFLKLCSQKVAELESEIEKKHFRELEELQKLEQLQSGIDESN
jgi:hypothetical protein